MATESVKGYGSILKVLKFKTRQARLQASIAVNTELLKISIGRLVIQFYRNKKTKAVEQKLLAGLQKI